MQAFHINWTRPFFVRNSDSPYFVEPFELLTTALSALSWRRHNGSILMICDRQAAHYYQTLGLSFLWDGGIHPLLDAIPEDINPMAFWAAGKLFALSAVAAPCVMIDTDFIVWKSISELFTGCDAAAIHREELSPQIYPGPEAFTKVRRFDLHAYDWSVQPLNTALVFLGNDSFRRYYTDAAITFMRSAPAADDVLTYMVFAEQRLFAMCAKKQNIHVKALGDLSELFGGGQQYFTHVWGFKQQMRDSSDLYDNFCLRCATRLRRDYPEAVSALSSVPTLTKFF